MFFDRDIKGDHLPRGTLCLTYDDGPGRETLEVGRYLHGEGIRATFFVMGRHAEGQRDTLRRLSAWGHLVGNHTYSHPGLVALAKEGGDVVGELERTAEVIRPFVAGGVVFFRPPYGNWREKEESDPTRERPTSVVAGVLNSSGRLRDHVGPVNWDVSGHDYDHWRRGAPAEECAAEYLERVANVGRGIVLMHDSSDEEVIRANNRVLELTRLLVPALKGRGYRFVRLDEVPQVRSACGRPAREGPHGVC